MGKVLWDMGITMSGIQNAVLAAVLILGSAVPFGWKVGRFIHQRREKPRLLWWAIIGLIGLGVVTFVALGSILLAEIENHEADLTLLRNQLAANRTRAQTRSPVQRPTN